MSDIKSMLKLAEQMMTKDSLCEAERLEGGLRIIHDVPSSAAVAESEPVAFVSAMAIRHHIDSGTSQTGTVLHREQGELYGEKHLALYLDPPLTSELEAENARLRNELHEAKTRIAALEAQLAEWGVELREARRLISGSHKRAVKHDNCEKPYCPICEGGLFVCADCGAAEIETEQRLCTGPALESTPPALKVTEEIREFVLKQSSTDPDIKAATGDRSEMYLTAAQEVGKP